VQVDTVGQAAVMVRSGTQAIFGNQAEVITLLQTFHAVLDGGGGPELLFSNSGRLLELALVPQLREDHVPGSEGHDDQKNENGAGYETTCAPECFQAIRIVGGWDGCVFHSFLESQKAGHEPGIE